MQDPATGLYNAVEVVADAIRPVDSETESEVLEEFLRSGAVLTMTDRICV